MSACAVLRRIEKVSQRVANFLDRPGRLGPSEVERLRGEIETVIAGVRNLPLSAKHKQAILRHLTQAITILRNNRQLPRALDQLLAVIQLLQIVGFKIRQRKLPCPPGKITVFPSNRFNTICADCQ